MKNGNAKEGNGSLHSLIEKADHDVLKWFGHKQRTREKRPSKMICVKQREQGEGKTEEEMEGWSKGSFEVLWPE